MREKGEGKMDVSGDAAEAFFFSLLYSIYPQQAAGPTQFRTGLLGSLKAFLVFNALGILRKISQKKHLTGKKGSPPTP